MFLDASWMIGPSPFSAFRGTGCSLLAKAIRWKLCVWWPSTGTRKIRKDMAHSRHDFTWFYIASTHIYPTSSLFFADIPLALQASESAMADTDPQKAWIFRGFADLLTPCDHESLRVVPTICQLCWSQDPFGMKWYETMEYTMDSEVTIDDFTGKIAMILELSWTAWWVFHPSAENRRFSWHWQAKYLNNREEMNQALTNFTDAHNSLIQNKDDYMNNQNLGPISHHPLGKSWKMPRMGNTLEHGLHWVELVHSWEGKWRKFVIK